MNRILRNGTQQATKICHIASEHYWQSACLLRCATATSAQLHSNSCTLHTCTAPTTTHAYQTIKLIGTSRFNNLPQLAKHYSTPQKPGNFFGKILDNLKDKSEHKNVMNENIIEFKKDLQEFGKSETVIKAREKFRNIESETAEGTLKAKQQLEKLKGKVSQSVEDAQNIEIIQKATKLTGNAKDRVQQVGQNLSQKGEDLSKTQAFQKMTDTARAVKEEINASALSGAGMRVYRAPSVLRMRAERNLDAEERIMEANTHATGVVLHKDSRFNQSWQEFKDTNPYVNRVMEWKTKLDESDHVIVRATSLVKDKISELFGPVFAKTDLSDTLTEIVKMDPNFEKDTFLLEVEYDLIPNILEAMIRPDLKILEDWTTERAYSLVAAELKQNTALGHHKIVKVLDVDGVDIVMGQVLENGPVLFVSFQVQAVDYTANSSGDIIEGDPDQVMRRQYVFALLRDMAELNPRAAWRLLDFSYQSTAQLV